MSIIKDIDYMKDEIVDVKDLLDEIESILDDIDSEVPELVDDKISKVRNILTSALNAL